MHHTATFRMRLSPQEGPPAPLSEVAGWQGKVERHVVEILASLHRWCRFLIFLCRRWWTTCRIPERPMAVQVIEVSLPRVLARPGRGRESDGRNRLVPGQLWEIPTRLRRSIFRNHSRSPSRAPCLSNVPGSGWPRPMRIWRGSRTTWLTEGLGRLHVLWAEEAAVA